MIKQGKLTAALINVVMEGDYQYDQEIPLGMAYVGAFLRKHGYTVAFKQCFAKKGEAEFKAAAEIKADVYGFQLNMVNYESVRSVVKNIKSRVPEAITIFGGPFLVSLSEKILRNEPSYDFIIAGEGETAVLELMQALERQEKDFSGINGLVWRNEASEIIRNKPRGLIEELDMLPFPARDFLEDIKRDPRDNGIVESLRMVTSRGCIGRCSFCCVNLYNKVQKGKIWRGRSPKNVVDELEHLNKVYKAKVFNFSDSSFEDPGELGKARSREICEEIIRRGLQVSIKVYLRCETMKSQEDIDLLKLYKKAGIDVIIPGAECGTDYELRLYGKNATVEDNYRTLTTLKGLDLFFVFPGFIMFGPNSTMETIGKNIDFLHELGFADNLMTISNVLMLLRDSRLYKMLMEEGRVIESEKYWELPKYKIKDPLAARMSKHWQNSLARFSAANRINKLQVNTSNLISRMTNPMNAKVLDALKDEYSEFRERYRRLSAEFGKLQHDCFVYTMRLIENNCPDGELSSAADDFFVKKCGDYLPVYEGLYNDFLDKIAGSDFSLSGLVFNHFTSAMTIEETERVDVKL